jgi:hypothetical protein
MDTNRITHRLEIANAYQQELSALPHAQYKQAMQTDPETQKVGKKKVRWDRKLYRDLFKRYSDKPNPYRIYLDLDGNEVDDVEPLPEIADYLLDKGYVIENYLSKKAFPIDKSKSGSKNGVRIGSLLSDSPELLKKYEQDPALKGSRKSAGGNLMIVISRHPYDILGASTDRGWDSCFNLGVHGVRNVKHPERGVHWNYAISDAKYGAIIAYLIDTTEQRVPNVKGGEGKLRLKPMARLSIRPFTSSDNPKLPPILWHSGVVYGHAPNNFQRTVERWLRENFDISGKVYSLDKRLYPDRSGTHIPLAHLSNLKGKELDDAVLKTLEERPNDTDEVFISLTQASLREPALKVITRLAKQAIASSKEDFANWRENWNTPNGDGLWPSSNLPRLITGALVGLLPRRGPDDELQGVTNSLEYRDLYKELNKAGSAMADCRSAYREWQRTDEQRQNYSSMEEWANVLLGRNPTVIFRKLLEYFYISLVVGSLQPSNIKEFMFAAETKLVSMRRGVYLNTFKSHLLTQGRYETDEPKSEFWDVVEKEARRKITMSKSLVRLLETPTPE